MTNISIALTLSSCVLAALGQYLFKLGANGKSTWQEYCNIYITTGALAYLIGAVIWVYIMSNEKLTSVYPFTMLTFVLVYLAGVFFLGEKLSIQVYMGLACIFIGLALIAKS